MIRTQEEDVRDFSRIPKEPLQRRSEVAVAHESEMSRKSLITHSDSPREHRTIGERSLSVCPMLTLFYDFHLIIVRTTLIRRLRKTRTTSKNCKTGCELGRDELYRLYYTRYHAIRYEIKQPVHEKNERSFDQLIDHVRTLHTILHKTVFWFSTR